MSMMQKQFETPKTDSNFINQTYYIIPLRLNDFESTKKAIGQDSRWSEFTFPSVYLLSHASQLLSSRDLFIQYSYNNPKNIQINNASSARSIEPYLKPEFSEYEKITSYLDGFHISEIYFSAFSTGIGFLEFVVEYPDLPVQFVIDHSYCLRRPGQTGPSFHTVISELLPDACRYTAFFYCGNTDRKKECICYHLLKYSSEYSPEEHQKWTYLISHGYNTSFPFDPSVDYYAPESEAFCYSPNRQDTWAGSQLSLVNLNYGNSFFLNTYKLENLKSEYHFMYLSLLNQRFSSIAYLDELISISTSSIQNQHNRMRDLNHRIIKLNTIFSVRVVSNDTNHQTVYKKLYEIMEIDSLLADLKDTEGQISELEMLLHEKEQEELLKKTQAEARRAESREKITQQLLFAISILAIFSALIDSTDYFSQFESFPFIPKWFSLIVIVVVIILFFIKGFWDSHRNRHR